MWGSSWTRDLDQQNMAQNAGIKWGNVVNRTSYLTALAFVTHLHLVELQICFDFLLGLPHKASEIDGNRLKIRILWL